MAYDNTALEAQVRALIPNITVNQVSNANLDRYGGLAIRRLFRDKPFERTWVLTGSGGKYYAFPADWIVGRSSIKKVYRPTNQQVSNSRDIVLLWEKEFQIFPDADASEKLYLVDSLGSSETVNIVYQTPWLVTSIDGAVTTNLPTYMQSALEFLTAAITCYALASQAAGVTDSAIPGDLISYRSKQQEYHRAAVDWEAQYAKELGLNQPVTAAAVKADYDPLLQVGASYVNHFRR